MARTRMQTVPEEGTSHGVDEERVKGATLGEVLLVDIRGGDGTRYKPSGKNLLMNDLMGVT